MLLVFEYQGRAETSKITVEVSSPAFHHVHSRIPSFIANVTRHSLSNLRTGNLFFQFPICSIRSVPIR